MVAEPEDETSAEELFGDQPTEAPVKKTRAKKVEATPVEEVRLHDILSNEDYLLAKEAAKKHITKERRLAAMQAVKTMELNRLRIEEGLTSGIAEDDALVDILIDLPEWAPNINNNFGQTAYWHGRSYTVSTAIARSLNEQMHRAWRHEDQLDGKSRSQMLHRKRETTISARTGATSNAPARFDA